jgi:hypothetical protein
MRYNEKRYFLKNSNLLEEVHNSKLTYCCYEKDEYSKYDIICKDYRLITPNIISQFFTKNPDREYIIVRVITDEHVLEYCKNGKINLQELKMKPFKHFLIMKSDFEKVYSETENNFDKIDKLTSQILALKERKKDNNRIIRLNRLEKNKQVPYKENNKECDDEILELTEEIKRLSYAFSSNIMQYAKEVLRSHWSGKTIEGGHFDVSQGHLSEGLVYMIIMLVDQFAKSGNWSGYTYLDDMKGSALLHLCDVALKFEESESSNVFAYLTQIASNKFTATLNSEKTQRIIKSTLMQDAGYNPTFGEMVNEEFKNIYYDDIVDENDGNDNSDTTDYNSTDEEN